MKNIFLVFVMLLLSLLSIGQETRGREMNGNGSGSNQDAAAVPLNPAISINGANVDDVQEAIDSLNNRQDIEYNKTTQLIVGASGRDSLLVRCLIENMITLPTNCDTLVVDRRDSLIENSINRGIIFTSITGKKDTVRFVQGGGSSQTLTASNDIQIISDNVQRGNTARGTGAADYTRETFSFIPDGFFQNYNTSVFDDIFTIGKNGIGVNRDDAYLNSGLNLGTNDSYIFNVLGRMTIQDGNGNMFINQVNNEEPASYGTWNVFMNRAARLGNFSSFNHVSGFQAGFQGTAGSYNYIEGTQALFQGTAGNSVNIKGEQAAYKATLGSNIIIKGKNAAAEATVGNATKIQGAFALEKGSTGEASNIEGGDAGREGNFGVGTFVKGRSAGKKANFDDYVTLVDESAGALSEGENDNWYQKRQAGYASLTKSDNLFLMRSAGTDAEVLSNNIFIGVKANALKIASTTNTATFADTDINLTTDEIVVSNLTNLLAGLTTKNGATLAAGDKISFRIDGLTSSAFVEGAEVQNQNWELFEIVDIGTNTIKFVGDVTSFPAGTYTLAADDNRFQINNSGAIGTNTIVEKSNHIKIGHDGLDGNPAHTVGFGKVKVHTSVANANADTNLSVGEVYYIIDVNGGKQLFIK